jgi:hypothetical protein
MPPRDLASLLDYLIRNRLLSTLAGNLLSQWGPQGRRLLGPDFMPPRVVDENFGEIERLHFYTVSAKDKTRHSAAPKVDGGQMFGTIRYKLNDSGLLREFNARDYDALIRYLNNNQSMQAIAQVEGFADTAILQALVEHDEFKIWQALTTGGYQKFGDNGYVELVNGPNLAGQFLDVTDDWTNPAINPWPTIEARIQRLVNNGYDKSGIRVVFTDQVRQILKNNPHTAVKAGKSVLVTDTNGVVQTQPISGLVDDNDIANIFRSLGVQAPVAYDLRGFAPGHAQKRFYSEGCMTFVGSTGVTEEVRWNENNPSDVQIVTDVVGFNGIGRANGQPAPGRKVWMRQFTEQTDARLEGEGTQATGPVLLMPEAVCGLNGITS